MLRNEAGSHSKNLAGSLLPPQGRRYWFEVHADVSGLSVRASHVLGRQRSSTELTQWSRVFLEMLGVSYVVRKLADFYGTHKSTTVFSRSHDYTSSGARWIQSMFLYASSLIYIL